MVRAEIRANPIRTTAKLALKFSRKYFNREPN
jgi:hypothetical protein